MTDFTYQFPATRWSTAPATAVALSAQANKVEAEATEARVSARTHQPFVDTAVELMDCLVAAETGLRMLEAAGVDLDAAKEAVLAKNEARSYWRGHPFDSIEASS